MPDYTYRCLRCETITPASHAASESPVIPCSNCGGLTRRAVLSAPQIKKNVPTSNAKEHVETDAHECHPHCAMHFPREHWLTPDPHLPDEHHAN